MRIIALALFVFISCKSSTKGQSQKEDLVQEIVTRELGDKSVISKNSTHSFALALIEKEGSVRYLVIRLSDNKVVINKSIRGSVNWDGDMQIRESLVPGMVKKDSKPEDYIKVIDLKKYIVQMK